MADPGKLHYTKDHEWVQLEGNRAKVGITAHAQSQLGDIVFVELPEVGGDFKRGDILGTVESVKAVSDIFAPMSGSIVEVNSELEATPETMNEDPYGAGWLVVIEVSNPSEADELLDSAAYDELASEE